MSEQRDGTGTGTGVWAHPAAEPEQPEPEPQRCVCGACHYSNGAWWWNAKWIEDHTPVARTVQVQHCPALNGCGCRLSVVDGEPVVGEKYADLERDAKRFRAVAEDVHECEMLPSCIDEPAEWSFETGRTITRYATLGEYADALGGEPDE